MWRHYKLHVTLLFTNYASSGPSSYQNAINHLSCSLRSSFLFLLFFIVLLCPTPLFCWLNLSFLFPSLTSLFSSHITPLFSPHLLFLPCLFLRPFFLSCILIIFMSYLSSVYLSSVLTFITINRRFLNSNRATQTQVCAGSVPGHLCPAVLTCVNKTLYQKLWCFSLSSECN